MSRSWALVQQYVHSRNTYPWRHYKNVNERRRGGREENQLSTRAHAGLAARSRWPRPRRRPRSAGCRLRNGSRLFALFAPSQHVGSAASKNLSSMNDSTRERGREGGRAGGFRRDCGEEIGYACSTNTKSQSVYIYLNNFIKIGVQYNIWISHLVVGL